MLFKYGFAVVYRDFSQLPSVMYTGPWNSHSFTSSCLVSLVLTLLTNLKVCAHSASPALLSLYITGDIVLGWQPPLETLLLPEPRNMDGQELDHSIPKLPQTFSEAAEQCNLIKVKCNPPFLF